MRTAIHIHELPGDAVLDVDMLTMVLARIARQMNYSRRVDIYPSLRVPKSAPPYRNPGWLEWTIRYTCDDGHTFDDHAIQRKPGAEYEFHS